MTRTSTVLLLNLILACGVAGLTGCAGVVIGGAATGAAVANDPRTTGTVIDDQGIEIKAHNMFNADDALDKLTHIEVTSYNGMVLLTGQAPKEELKARAADLVSRIAKVRHVYNEIEIGQPTSGMVRTNDGLITTKVKAKLVSIKNLESSRIKVVTENSVVYLLGFLDKPTADAVADVVAGLSPVRKVVKLFEYPNQATPAPATNN